MEVQAQGATNAAATADAGASAGDGSTTESTTYTAADLQREVDRRVTDAMKAAEAKAAKQVQAALEAEEQKRLAEQGEFKALHEKAQSELNRLNAELEAKNFRESVLTALADAGLSEFAPTLMGERSKPEDFVAAAKSLQESVKKLADSEIATRLETGASKGTTPAANVVQARGIFQYPSMAAK